MSDSFKNQVYNNLNQKETSELVKIWIKNDRFEWSDVAFEMIQKILEERGEERPQQGKPILEQSDDDDTDLLNLEYDDEPELSGSTSQPVFYNPVDTLLLIDWIEWAAKASIYVAILNGIYSQYFAIFSIASDFSAENVPELLKIIIAIGVNVFFSGFVSYLTLRAIAYVLKILMEFEHNSRGVK
jgi:hypothetical protein